MRKNNVYRLAIDSMMASMYFVLAYFSIRLGNITITPASICIILVSLLYSPCDSLLVAIVGEMINQTAKYGIGPTTALWIIPCIIRSLIISITAAIYRNHNSYLEDHKVMYFITLMFSALMVTTTNTCVIYLDAKLLGYPISYTIIETVFRFISGIITSIVVAIISLPILYSTRKMNIGREPLKRDVIEKKKRA